MKTSDKLFKLIKSLDKQEKRYFKIFAARHTINGSNNYIKLFDAIARQKEYDEEAIKQMFKKEVFVKNLSASKYYLNNLILKSLHSYHSGNTVNAEIKENMHYVEILFEKGLFDHCWNIIKKTKKLAKKYENSLQMLEILRWEGKLRKIRNELNEVYKEEEVTIKKLINFNEYDKLGANLYNLTKNKGVTRTKEQLKGLENIFENPLMKDVDKALTFQAKCKYYYTHGTYYFILGDFKNCYKYVKTQVDLIEANPHQIKENPIYYIEMCTNLFIVQMELHKFDECRNTINKIRSFNKNVAESHSIQSRVFSLFTMSELFLCKTTGDFSDYQAITKNVREGLQKFDGLISEDEKMIIQSRMAVMYFCIGKYTEALHWLNQALNNKAIDDRSDLSCFARLMNLIIHFKLKNNEYLEYTIKSTYNFLSKKNWLFKLEKLVISYIKQRPVLEKRSEINRLYDTVNKGLIEISTEPLKQNALYYFDFISWLEGEVQEKPITDIIHGKLKAEAVG